MRIYQAMIPDDVENDYLIMRTVIKKPDLLTTGL